MSTAIEYVSILNKDCTELLANKVSLRNFKSYNGEIGEIVCYECYKEFINNQDKYSINDVVKLKTYGLNSEKVKPSFRKKDNKQSHICDKHKEVKKQNRAKKYDIDTLLGLASMHMVNTDIELDKQVDTVRYIKDVNSILEKDFKDLSEEFEGKCLMGRVSKVFHIAYEHKYGYLFIEGCGTNKSNTFVSVKLCSEDINKLTNMCIYLETTMEKYVLSLSTYGFKFELSDDGTRYNIVIDLDSKDNKALINGINIVKLNSELLHRDLFTCEYYKKANS